MAPGTQQFSTSTAYYPVGAATNAMPASDKPAPILDIELDSLQSHINALANLANRTRSVGDRMLGGEPSPIKGEGQNGRAAEITPVTIQLRQKRDLLGEVIDALRHQVERLESL